MTLAESCYESMFLGCESLQAVPSLPATTLAPSCYEFMFDRCYSLKTAPETLPALKMESRCYKNMFSNCALTKAPELPATTLAEMCYYDMFGYCSGLVSGPLLPATELADECYIYMFEYCIRLTQVDIKATTNVIRANLDSMLSNTAIRSTGIINCTQAFVDAVGSNTWVVPSNWSTNVVY